MRLLPLLLLLLTACYDEATTTVTVDVAAGQARVHQQLHNAWPDEVGCVDQSTTTVEQCVAAIRGHLDEAREGLAKKGATDVTSGIVLAEGELDLVYDYAAPIGSEALNDGGLSFAYVEDQSPAQVRKDRPGKRHVALLAVQPMSGNHTYTIDGRARRITATLPDGALTLHLFKGKEVTVRSEWTHTPGENEPKSPGAWLRAWPGLEDALRASGLVVVVN